MHNNKKYTESRFMAANKFLAVELRLNDINIKEVKMSKNNESAIMLITVNEHTVKNVYL